MSSRIVSGAAAKTAESYAWARTAQALTPHPPAGQACPDPGADPPEVESLRVRIAELENQLATRVPEAQKNGRREGEAAVQQQFAAQVQDALGRLAKTIEILAGTRAKLRHESEEDVVKLAIALARKILNREISVDPDAMLGVIKAALQKIDARELHRVRVHPSHAQALQDAFNNLGLPNQIQVQSDRTLEVGAAILETSRGTLDASVETQLREIERGFGDMLRGGQA